jgi:hypothetical protein
MLMNVIISTQGIYIRERIEPGFAGSGLVRFDSVFSKSARVRIDSTLFFKSPFEFGSARLEPNRTSSTQFGSFSHSAEYNKTV